MLKVVDSALEHRGRVAVGEQPSICMLQGPLFIQAGAVVARSAVCGGRPRCCAAVFSWVQRLYWQEVSFPLTHLSHDKLMTNGVQKLGVCGDAPHPRQGGLQF